MTDGDTTSGRQHATAHPAGAELLPDLARELAEARAQIVHLKPALDNEPHRPAPRPSLPAGAVPITTRRYGTQWRVTAHGDLDLSVSDELATAIHQGMATASEVEHIVVDVGDVTFLDCSCLGVLVRAHAAATSSAISLTLVNVPPCVDRLLKLTDLTALAEPPASRARPSLN